MLKSTLKKLSAITIAGTMLVGMMAVPASAGYTETVAVPETTNTTTLLDQKFNNDLTETAVTTTDTKLLENDNIWIQQTASWGGSAKVAITDGVFTETRNGSAGNIIVRLMPDNATTISDDSAEIDISIDYLHQDEKYISFTLGNDKKYGISSVSDLDSVIDDDMWNGGAVPQSTHNNGVIVVRGNEVHLGRYNYIVSSDTYPVDVVAGKWYTIKLNIDRVDADRSNKQTATLAVYDKETGSIVGGRTQCILDADTTVDGVQTIDSFNGLYVQTASDVTMGYSIDNVLVTQTVEIPATEKTVYHPERVQTIYDDAFATATISNHKVSGTGIEHTINNWDNRMDTTYSDGLLTCKATGMMTNLKLDLSPNGESFGADDEAVITMKWGVPSQTEENNETGYVVIGNGKDAAAYKAWNKGTSAWDAPTTTVSMNGGKYYATNGNEWVGNDSAYMVPGTLYDLQIIIKNSDPSSDNQPTITTILEGAFYQDQARTIPSTAQKASATKVIDTDYDTDGAQGFTTLPNISFDCSWMNGGFMIKDFDLKILSHGMEKDGTNLTAAAPLIFTGTDTFNVNYASNTAYIGKHNYKIIVAQYDEDERMISVNGDTTADHSGTVTVTPVAGAKTIKLFILDTTNAMPNVKALTLTKAE